MRERWEGGEKEKERRKGGRRLLCARFGLKYGGARQHHFFAFGRQNVRESLLSMISVRTTVRVSPAESQAFAVQLVLQRGCCVKPPMDNELSRPTSHRVAPVSDGKPHTIDVERPGLSPAKCARVFSSLFAGTKTRRTVSFDNQNTRGVVGWIIACGFIKTLEMLSQPDYAERNSKNSHEICAVEAVM